LEQIVKYLGVKVFPGRILEGFLPPTPPLALLFPVADGIFAAKALELCSIGKLTRLSVAESKSGSMAVLLFPVTVGTFVAKAFVLCSIDVEEESEEPTGLSVAESRSGSRAVPPPEYEPTGTCEPGPMNGAVTAIIACEISVLLSKLQFSLSRGSPRSLSNDVTDTSVVALAGALELGIAEVVLVPLASLEVCMRVSASVTASELGIEEVVLVLLASLEVCMRVLLPVVIESEREDTEATTLSRDTASDAEDKVFTTYHQLVAYE
jgi:hypothetical protein